MLCLLFLPLFLPFLILRVLIKTAVALVMLPIAFLGAGIIFMCVAFAVSMAILAPLIPFAILAAGIWLLIKIVSPRRPAITHF